MLNPEQPLFVGFMLSVQNTIPASPSNAFQLLLLRTSYHPPFPPHLTISIHNKYKYFAPEKVSFFSSLLCNSVRIRCETLNR